MKRIKISVVDGVAGHSLSVGNDVGGTRMAGPKPWGGGKIVHEFECDVDELIEAINSNSYTDN